MQHKKQVLSKLMLILVTVLLLMNLKCPGSKLENHIDLYVPYFEQETTYYCAIACIQMWAAKDGITATQQEIANYIGMGVCGVNPMLLERGVAHFTCSEGYLALKSIWEPGAQGDLISATITGVKYGIPSIMPFFVDHTVLIKGYKYREDIPGKPIAIEAYYHDPNRNPNQRRTAAQLSSNFDPSGSTYWVLVGFPDLMDMGIDGHNAFILSGGTYYGGPSYYDPKGLTPDPSLPQ